MDFWNHNARVPLETAIATHRYTQRLRGYTKNTVFPSVLPVQDFTALDFSQPPDERSHSSSVNDGGARRKEHNPHISAHGNLAQDAATAHVLQKLAEEYLRKYGYSNIELFRGVSFSLVQYPLEEGSALAVTFMNTLMAKLCGPRQNLSEQWRRQREFRQKRILLIP